MREINVKQDRRSERVKIMVDNFHQDFMDGLNIPEIADKYHVSKSYVYIFLEEIALKNGVCVETYYQRDHGPHICIARDGRLLPHKNLSYPEIDKRLQNALSSLREMRSRIEEQERIFEEHTKTN